MSYECIKGQMKTGDLLLWRSETIIGWLIRKWGGEVNHASQVWRIPQYEGNEDRRYIMEALEDGVKPRLLSERLAGHKGQCWWYPLHGAFELERDKIGERLLEFDGKAYDYGSLFRNVFGHVSAEASKLFCSEMVFLAMGCTGKAPRPNEMLTLGFWDREKGVQIK